MNTTDNPTRTLYVIRAQGTDFYKIGITGVDIERRMKGLQTGCPYQLELVEWYTCPAKMEREMHGHLAAHRVQGEWFELSDLVELRSILATYRPFTTDLLKNEVAYIGESVRPTARFQKAWEIAKDQDVSWLLKLILVLWSLFLPVEHGLKRRAPNDGEVLQRRAQPDNPYVVDLSEMDYQYREDEL